METPQTLSVNEQANQIYYDQTATDYEGTGRIYQSGNKLRIQRLLKTLIPNPNITAMDVCCGAGLYLSLLKEFVSPNSLYGTDISSGMLSLAKKHCKNLTAASVYELPFPDNSFDMITASSALHHLDDIEKAVSEIFRVLKPEGLFLTDYDNSLHFAKFNALKRRCLRLLMVYPIFKKLFSNKTHVHHTQLDRPLKEMPLEELHEFAEPQNTLHDGIDSNQLVKLFKKVGFKKTDVFTFHSHKWNAGLTLSPFTKISNNKLYSISIKS